MGAESTLKAALAPGNRSTEVANLSISVNRPLWQACLHIVYPVFEPSDFSPHIAQLAFKPSDIRSEVSALRFGISDLRCELSDLRLEPFHLGFEQLYLSTINHQLKPGGMANQEHRRKDVP